MKHLLTLALCFSLLACKSEMTIEIGLHGNVSSDDGTINCPDTCIREILDQETITLTASSNSDAYSFHHWEGACTGPDPVCVLDVHPLLPFQVKAQFTYTGKKLSDINFEDPNLLECIQETVEDYPYRQALLLSLYCPNREIRSLAGIEQIGTLHSNFQLDDNLISDLSPLENHRFIGGLYLRNNSIADPSALTHATIFGGTVFLAGNPDLDCDILERVIDESIGHREFRAPQCPSNIGEIPHCNDSVDEICIITIQPPEPSDFSETNND